MKDYKKGKTKIDNNNNNNNNDNKKNSQQKEDLRNSRFWRSGKTEGKRKER